jgi:hypothetical protein
MMRAIAQQRTQSHWKEEPIARLRVSRAKSLVKVGRGLAADCQQRIDAAIERYPLKHPGRRSMPDHLMPSLQVYVAQRDEPKGGSC